MKAPQSLPQPRLKSGRDGRTLSEISVRLEVVTPILGGGFQTRMVDDIDVIRAVTVRGHLRFWWRALRGHEFGSPADLHAAESALWGRAATDEGGRSAVEIRVEVEQPGTIDDSDIRLYDSKDGQATRGAYALWPARAEKEKGQIKTPPAPRRTPGTRFRLTLIEPENRESEIRNVVRAWILFGGYGSRTRRGLGSFKVIDDANAWLPGDETREAFTALFARDVFAPPGSSAIDAPWLAGASLHVGGPTTEAGQAWTTALEWLKVFRQGTSGQPGDRAREPGTGKPQPRRPSISNWPEADKIRHVRRKTNAHPPRHNATPAWPRAGFGLPIVGQFQKNARTGGWLEEPDGFELRWRSDGGEHDRLASPLILKALPLADGTFLPCALWLNRAYPTGEVVLRGTGNSAAPFDRLVASGDTARFSALTGRSTLRAAFLDWLRARYRTTAVAP
jgi:CRISPR-associated protein Cmr1